MYTIIFFVSLKKIFNIFLNIKFLLNIDLNFEVTVEITFYKIFENDKKKNFCFQFFIANHFFNLKKKKAGTNTV